tara:strand:- start:45 stop:1286 length:1242 start_codon:yes stop_codon:yes gene_type:complete
MANVQNLTTKHIAGHATKAGQRIIPNKSYEKTAALLFDKVLVKSTNWSHDFATKKQGILVSESFSVTYTDGTTIDYTNSNQRKSYISKMHSAVSAVVKGHAKGKDKSSVEVRHTQLVKTTEFGGQGVGTKKESKGTIFEREFANRLKECINGEPCKGKYHEAAGYLIGQLESKGAGKDPNIYQIVDVEQEGGKNQPRPIEVTGNTVYIAPTRHQDHAAKLTDITVTHANRTKSYLSAKYGPTLTFMNSGSKTVVTDNEIMNYNVTSAKAKNLFRIFGIDEDIFCDVFNNYGKASQTNKSLKHSGKSESADIPAIKKFTQTAMGSDYWMVHAQTNGKVDMYYMDPKDVIGNYSTVVGDVVIRYGGKSGNAKRINVEYSSANFDFTFNIRSKGGTVFPTNIMLDYKSKDINKETL